MQVKPSYIYSVILAIGLWLPNATHAGGIITFSFDDNYEKQYSAAAPILEAKGWRGTFYVITKRIGWAGLTTQAQILDLQTRGHEIGLHTELHQNMTLLSRTDRINDLFRARHTLELLFNTYTLAYPHGAHNSTVREDVKRAGYLVARGTDKALNYPTTNRFALNSHSLKSITAITDVQSMINAARSQNAWYSMHIHQVDGSGDYNITSSFLQQVVNSIPSDMQVLTIAEAGCTFYPTYC